MASKAGEQWKHLERQSKFVKRFVYDVLVYTLRKCGLPETSLPTTDCAENAYHRDHFVKVAGASTLRISLIMRDKWKKMFISRRNSSGFSNENVLSFLKQLILCCPLSRRNISQSLVELLLASCNEIIMYFHIENMNIDFNIVMKSISVYIIGVIGFDEKNSNVIIENLFDSFDDISAYTDWITDFITKFGIPYGSRDNVSDLFFERVRIQFKDEQRKLRDSLGFLPHDLFLAITVEELENFSQLTSIPSNSKPPETPKLPPNSGTCAVGGLSPGSQSARSDNISEHLAQSLHRSENSSELMMEHDLRKISLNAEEASHESSGTAAKHKPAKNEKDNDKQEGS